MWILMFYSGVLGFVFLFISGGLSSPSVSNRHDGTEKDEKPVVKSEKSPKVQRAEKWQEALRNLGEERDFNKLLEQAKNDDVLPHEIPFQAVLTKKEYRSLLFKLLTDEEVDNLKSDGYASGFDFDTLNSAIYAKNLTLYVDSLAESLDLLNEKANGKTLSDALEEKRRSLQKEYDESLEELLSIIRLRNLPNNLREMVFSNVVLMDEDELLDVIEAKTKKGKPVAKTAGSSAEVVTSPALIELNEFLNENDLPNDVYKELQETMSQIESKLRKIKKDKEVESVRFEAQALNETAKKYHEIS